MGEIVSPAIARLRALRERSDRAALRASQVAPPDPARPAMPELGEPRRFEGTLDEIAALLPRFERRAFDAASREDAEHPHLGVIVRRAAPDVGLIDLPVGLTRRQPLVSHGRVIEALQRALGAARADPQQVRAGVELTDCGARMTLALAWPEAFGCDLGAGERLDLRLACWNSMDGGGPRLLLAWQRTVCAVSIPVGITRPDYRLAERLPMPVGDIAACVQRLLERAAGEREALACWRQTLVTRARLALWVDGAVRRIWGPRVAARVFHAAVSGWDAEPAFGFERVPPSRRTMRATMPIPFAPRFAETVYDALLSAAWVAAQERDAQRRIDRQIELCVLMRALLRGEHAR
ncbi:MAG TPA: hypothetical protein VNM24_04900 [Burkholderiales bacterium]|jgi:hypothetical protein|nr:hypothetical protein [Burkholderiales bacterium]